MHLLRTLRHLFDGKRDLRPVFSRQADLLCQSSDTLVRMLNTLDPEQWKVCQREIKSCEKQGDALLTDFREMTKSKNLAELFEKATDSEKHVADCIRLMMLRYLHE